MRAAGFNGWKSVTGSIQYTEESAPTIERAMPPNVLCCDARGNGDGKTACTLSGDHDSRTGDFANVVVMPEYVLRRLTPRECERLQGFPDDHTRYGADGREIKDTPRYGAIGNAVAVPCAEYVIKRIAAIFEKEEPDEQNRD
jgi:site-specific DNA-cytosine methylase